MSFTKKKWVIVLIAAMIGIIVGFVTPEIYGLTHNGRILLGIFVFTVICWVGVDVAWPSLLSITLIALLQLTTTTSVLQASYGAMLVGIMISAMFVTYPFEKMGILDYLSCWVLTRKFIIGHPYVFFLIVTILGTLLSGVSNLLPYFALMPLIIIICKRLEVKKGDRFYTATFFALLLGGGMGEAYLPFAKATYLVGSAIFGALGFTDNILSSFMSWSVPLMFINWAITLLLIKVVIRPNVSCFSNYDIDLLKERMQGFKWTSQRIMVIILFLFFVVTQILPIWAQKGGIFQFFSVRTMLPVGYMLGLIYLLVPFTNEKTGLKEPTIKFKEFTSEFPWGLILFLACTSMYGTLLNSPDFGISGMLTGILQKLTGGMTVMTVMILAMLFALILTNVMSNSVVVMVGISVFLPILSTYGINPAFAAAIIIFCATSAIATPAGCPTTPMVIGPHIEQKNMYPVYIFVGIVAVEMIIIMKLFI